MILNIILCVIIVGVFCYYSNKMFNYWKVKNVRGPTPIMIFGNYKDVALRKKPIGIFYWDIYKQFPEEKVVGFYRMTSPALLIRDLDIMKQILIKDFEAFGDRGSVFSKAGLGQNIFHCDPETWKFLRHQFTSLYTTTKLKSVFPHLANCGDKFLDYVKTATMTLPDQEIYRLMLKYAVSTTMVGIFGLNVEIFNVDNENRLFDIIDENFVTSYLNEMAMMFPGLLTKLNLSLISGKMIKLSHQIIENGRQHHLISKNKINNLMDVLLNLEQLKTRNDEHSFSNITDDLLAAQTWFFYTAGTANMAPLLTYAFYHLARNVDVQEKLRQEIIKLTSKYNGILTYEAFKEMKYLNMVFYETLRLQPSTNAIVRSASRDIKLDGLDFTINKGTFVVMSPYSIQHDEKYYPEPEKFIPERFLPEDSNKRHICAFLPFGTGPRGCLGTQFAKLQVGICVAKVLSKFRVEVTRNTITDIDFKPTGMLLTPNQKIRLNLVPF